jgi:endogenous inhibitor of DNA gyrase (YacG/DUF329 family)
MVLPRWRKLMFCSNCGKEVNNDAVFCPYCGSKRQPTVQQEPKPAYMSSEPQCPTCGRPLIFLEDIKEWYCEYERKTKEPIPSKATSPSLAQTSVPVSPAARPTSTSEHAQSDRLRWERNLELLDQRFAEGKISEAAYKELKSICEGKLMQ